jgi:hypothetical protein
MNERVKKLAEQAGMIIIDDEFSTYGKFTKKFASLLIEEVIKIINTTPNHYCYTSYDVDQSLATREACIKQLKKELL